METVIRNSEILILLLATAVVEVVLATYFSVATVLDLPLIFAAYIGWHSSPARGAVSGFFFGILEDAVYGMPLGLNGLSKTIVGFLASYLNKWVAIESFFPRVFLIALLSLLDGTILLGTLSLLQQSLGQQGLFNTGIRIPVTGVIGGFVFHLYNQVKTPRKDFRHLDDM